MKTSFHPRAAGIMRRPKPGFALVVTLSLMILLTVIAVGLLTLSSISLRASSQGQAMATARSNARLALMLALGDLQKSLGPDRAVSATSEILTASPAKPHTTGVWESWWDFDPSKSPGYASEKTKRFRRWLVSSADPSATENRDFATAAWTGKTIELVGNASLGGNAPTTAKVVAGLVPVARAGKIQGAYAWHVADEAVKARVNLYRDPDQNTTLAQKRALLAGHRPDPSLMKGADGSLLTCLPTDLTAADFAKAKDQTGKIIDLEQIELLDAARGKIKQFRHDITPYSLGVMVDVRGGGLKQDLSSMFEMGSATANTLPAEFNNRKLYLTTHGLSGVSDPNWSALAGYYNSFRSITNPDTNPTFAVTAGAASTNPVPTGYNPAPVIAKVDTIFSLVGRPCTEIHWLDHNPGNNGALDNYDYFVGLIFTPVVTLHNPYNCNISLYKMQVTFLNVPVAFNFMFDGGGSGSFQSQGVVPGTFESLNTMLYNSYRGDKTFIMNIANWKTSDILATNSEISGPIVMKPGQTLICGPVLPPDASLKTDSTRGNSTIGFDWDNRVTSSIKAQPSYIPGLGFENYGATISHFRITQPWAPGGSGPGWCTFLFLRDIAANPKVSKTTVTDKFYVEFKMQRPSWYLDDSTTNKTDAAPSFAVTAQLQATASGTPLDYAKLQFNYTDDTSLKNIFNDRAYRYPPTGSLTGSACAAPGGITYSAQGAYVHPFAIFSAYARTTNGGVYETGKRTKGPVDSPQLNLLKDGRLAGKPFLFHNPSRANMTMNLATEKPGAQAYELNLQPLLSKGDYQDYMDVDASNRVPSLTGNKTTSGIKSGSYLELPTGPLQTIADFRRSNALTTSYLPHFVQPVGNSLLHPLMSADKVVETNSGLAATALLDHSVLANHALYDRFYFSTFATRGSTKPDTVFEHFVNGTAPLASQAFQPYLPGGKSVATAKAELFSSAKPKDSAYKNAAEYQMIRGPFNVNSTSVQAWKAVLAAMNKSEIATLWARTAGLETRTASGVPITAMSLMNGGANRTAAVDASKIDSAKSNDWNGYRVLTETELDNLAVKIVAEVRERGPFLSMSEFVNRQVGPVGPRTLAGALEAAITESEINEKKNAVSPDSFLDQVPITATDLSDPKLYNYKTPEATMGNPAAGAPGWVNQGDLLRILEPAATVRGDTFVIRVCGEAWDPAGKVTARAYAEAVVQRMPEYVDPVDRPSLNAYTDATAAKANKTFGRRINVVSFRWLSGNEI
ncbi:MAG: hypothetical protein NTW21_24400 [Verrucomicrobia bacterium]|nr:hypothetical protein [Verrucomicrobiota bacterium]